MAAELFPASQFWFLNTFVTVRVPASGSSDSISILEHRAPYLDSPPLHIHHTEDEIFHVLDGEFRFNIEGRVQRLGAGDILVAPKGIPHQYIIDSPEGGHWMTITVPGDFESFVRLVSRPAEHPELPEPSGPPSKDDIKALSEAALRFGIEIVGPPLH